VWLVLGPLLQISPKNKTGEGHTGYFEVSRKGYNRKSVFNTHSGSISPKIMFPVCSNHGALNINDSPTAFDYLPTLRAANQKEKMDGKKSSSSMIKDHLRAPIL